MKEKTNTLENNNVLNLIYFGIILSLNEIKIFKFTYNFGKPNISLTHN
jgi:hypothetical protein